MTTPHYSIAYLSPEDDIAGAKTYVLHGVPVTDDCHVLPYGCDGEEQKSECNGVFNAMDGNPIVPFLHESLLFILLS